MPSSWNLVKISRRRPRFRGASTESGPQVTSQRRSQPNRRNKNTNCLPITNRSPIRMKNVDYENTYLLLGELQILKNYREVPLLPTNEIIKRSDFIGVPFFSPFVQGPKNLKSGYVKMRYLAKALTCNVDKLPNLAVET